MKWAKPPVIKTAAQRRLAKMPSSDILNWCDQAGSGVARCLDDYRRLDLPESLLEAEMGLTALLDAIGELKGRAL